MLVAGIFFFASLILIVALFALKYVELRRGTRLAPSLRDRADQRALALKAMLAVSRREASRIPPTLIYLSGVLVHEAALGFAKIARVLERQAHNVADMVSHKRGFERKEPRSEFLKEMNGHKNGTSALDESENV